MLFHLSSSPFEKKQCELSLVLLPSFFKLASVYVFSGERFNHLVWDRVHISGSHAGSLGRGGYGPNQMPRHELMNLDTFLKTLSYLLSLKKVKLLLKKKKKKKCILLASLCTLEDLVRHVAHLPDGSKRPEELHPGCSLPGASSLLWPVVLGLLHPPDLSSRWPPYSYTGTIFSLLPICWVCVLIGLRFPIYMKDFFFFKYLCIYLFDSWGLSCGTRGSLSWLHSCGAWVWA